MIITETEMYWLTRLDYLSGFAMIAGTVGALMSLAVCALCFIENDDYFNTKRFKKNLWTTIPCFLMLIGSLFIPTTKEMCAIKLVPMVVNDEQVQEIPNKVVDLANEWLDELKPKKEEVQ